MVQILYESWQATDDRDTYLYYRYIYNRYIIIYNIYIIYIKTYKSLYIIPYTSKSFKCSCTSCIDIAC